MLPERGLSVVRFPARGSARLSVVAFRLAQSWPLNIVLLLFLGTAIVLPTWAPVAISDDWIYARGVESLIQHHRFLVLDTTTMTLLFQVVWGSLFAGLLGLGFGALRISTIVMVAVGAGFLYAICRDLGVDRERAALGAAIYLFNPLTFVLSFTFMTDPHFTSLVLAATFCYARGLREQPVTARWIVAGSIVSVGAVLIRQHGILVPVGALSYLLFTGQLRPNWTSAKIVARVALLPVLALAGFYVWLLLAGGLPSAQSVVAGSAVHIGVGEMIWLLMRLLFIAAMYFALLTLPLAVVVALIAPRLIAQLVTSRLILWMIAVSLLALVLVLTTALGMAMPYAPHFMTKAGLGPNDLVANRPVLLTWPRQMVLDGVCFVGASFLILPLVRAIKISSRSSPAMLVLCVGLWQGAAFLFLSLPYHRWLVDGIDSPSLDRYLLPVLPFVICLLLVSLKNCRLRLKPGWFVVAGTALVSVAGTHDALALQVATWGLAHEAHQAGMPNRLIDAGAAWDAYHLYYNGMSRQEFVRTPQYGVRPLGSDVQTSIPAPWWIWAWARQDSSRYIVSAAPLGNMRIVRTERYTSWLSRGTQTVYLLHRAGSNGE